MAAPAPNQSICAPGDVVWQSVGMNEISQDRDKAYQPLWPVAASIQEEVFISVGLEKLFRLREGVLQVRVCPWCHHQLFVLPTAFVNIFSKIGHNQRQVR